jgi:hypothetical protein
LRSNPGRRALFGIIGLLLLIAFFTGVDWQNDFGRSSIVGTLFYGVLTFTCLGVAAAGRTVHFLSADKLILFVNTVLGLTVHRETLEIGRVEAVTIQVVRFLKDSERPQPGLLNVRFQNYVSRRNSYYKLYLDMSDGRRMLEDSTDPTELQTAGTSISEFLGVPLRREEI